MEIINTLTSQIAVWKNFLTGAAGTLPTAPMLKTGAEVLLGLLVLLLIAYRFRTHQVRRERKIRYRIGRMIAHLCDTYDSLEDVDWKKQKAYRYHFVDGDLKIDQRDIEGIGDLIGPLHPSDGLKYNEDYIKGAIRWNSLPGKKAPTVLSIGRPSCSRESRMTKSTAAAACC